MKFTLLTAPFFHVLLWGSLQQNKFLIKKKQVLLLISLRPCFFKNKNYEQFLMKKIFIQKLFVVLKLSDFILKLIVSLLLVVVSVWYCIYCSWYVLSKAWLNFTGANLEFRGLNLSKMLTNLYQGTGTNTLKHHEKLPYIQYVFLIWFLAYAPWI